MRIICPTCASHYEVEPERIAAQGQLVRCAHCRDVWLVRATDRPASDARAAAVPTPIAPAGTPPGIAAAEVVDFQAARTRLRPRRKQQAGREWATSIGLFAAGAMLLSAAAALHSFRATVVAQVPGAAALYAAVGLPVANDALALRDVHSVLVAEGDETVLTLQGTIANTGPGPTPVPNLTVVVRGETKVPLYTWTATAPKPTLARGESIAFRSRLASPPVDGRDVRVSFADARPRSSAAAAP